jgi:molecular chaperone GrpE
MKKEEDKLKKCEKEKQEYLDGWKRAKADLINYKKEESERTTRLVDYTKEEILLEILPIMDNFHLADKEIPEEEKNNFIKGLLQIKSSLAKFLENQEVREIECLGKSFDPFFHEALEMVEGQEESGTIIEVIEKGYQMKGKLLRPAKVKIIK